MQGQWLVYSESGAGKRLLLDLKQDEGAKKRSGKPFAVILGAGESNGRKEDQS